MPFKRLLSWNMLAVTEKGRGNATGFLTVPLLETQKGRPIDASFLEELTRVVLGARTLDQSSVGRGPRDFPSGIFISVLP